MVLAYSGCTLGAVMTKLLTCVTSCASMYHSPCAGHPHKHCGVIDSVPQVLPMQPQKHYQITRKKHHDTLNKISHCLSMFI